MFQYVKRRIPVPIKKTGRRVINRIPVLLFRESLMHLAEAYLRRYYTWDMQRLWSGPHPPPEWFDHRADLFRWSEHRNPLWVERGVFSREVMFEGCKVLDLCCGDGFYPYHFYAEIASHVDAVDRDSTALSHARKWHTHPKVNYIQMDVVADDFPGINYDVIAWDGAIEHFSTEQIRIVLQKCVRALKTRGGGCCPAIQSSRAVQRRAIPSINTSLVPQQS